MGGPAHDPGHGKDGRKEVDRDAQDLVDKARVEVDVGRDDLTLALVDKLCRELGHEVHEGDLLGLVLPDGELPGLLPENGAPGVRQGVDRVAHAVDLARAVVGLALEDPGKIPAQLPAVFPVLHVPADVPHHGHHGLVGPAVQVAAQRSDTRADGHVGVGPARGHGAHREGRVVAAPVLGVQHEGQVEEQRLFAFGLLPLEKVQEILRGRELGVGLEHDEVRAVPVARDVVVVGHHRGELGDERDAVLDQVSDVGGGGIGGAPAQVGDHRVQGEHLVVVLRLLHEDAALDPGERALPGQHRGEVLQVLDSGELSGQQEVRHLLEPEAVFGTDAPRQLHGIVAAVEEPAVHGLHHEAALSDRSPLVADHLALGGDSRHHARSVGVSEAGLDVLGHHQLGRNLVVISRQRVDPAQDVLHTVSLLPAAQITKKGGRCNSRELYIRAHARAIPARTPACRF